MLTEAALKTLITANLADDKLYGIQLLLTELIKREKHDAVIPQYRMQNNLVDVTTLAGLISAIPAATVKIETTTTYFNSAALSTVPIVVTFPDIKVVVNSKFLSDSKLAVQHGTGNYKLAFVMGYVNDGDAALPLKIVNVLLV